MSAAPPPSTIVRAPGRGAVVAIVLVAFLSRALVLGDPVVHVDEQFYFALAHGWVRGALPYVDIWDRKPIGLFLLYAPAAALRDPAAGVIAYQVLALVAAAGAALLIAALARAAGWGAGAVPAALLYLLWLGLADGQGGQAPVLYNPIMALAALVALRSTGRRGGVAAMMLVGAAAQVKYSVVFEGAWFALWLLGRDRGAGRVGYAAALGAAAALPTLAAFAAYAAISEGGAWWFANIVSILHRAPAPAAEQAGNLATCVAILAIPVGLAVAGWRTRTAGTAPRFVYGWLAAALGGLAAFGTWFDHYTLPVLVPAAVGSAAVLGRGRARWVLLAVAAGAGQASILRARAERGTAAEFAALAAAVGRGPGCLYIESGPSMLYPFTGRCGVTRYRYPSHLTRGREAAAIGVDPAGEVRRLFAQAPAVVVMGRPFRGEAPAIRTLVLGELARGGYRIAATRPLGRDRLAIWIRPGGR